MGRIEYECRWGESSGLEQAGGILILQLLAQLDQLLLERQEPVTDGVWQVAVVHGGIGKPLALSFNHTGRHPDDSGIGGNGLEHNRIGADLHIVADCDPAEDLGPGPDDHMIAERGVAFTSLFTSSTKRDPLKERHVISDLCRFADHDPHAMVDKKTCADFGGGMDFNAGEPTSDLRNRSRNERHMIGLQPMWIR